MRSMFRRMNFAIFMVSLLMASDLWAAEYHVVIGSFAHEPNARRFAARAKDLFSEVLCSYSERTKLYYVSVMTTASKKDAQNLMFFLKNEKGFKDAWVMVSPDEDNSGEIRTVIAHARGRARFHASEPSDQIILPSLVASSRAREDSDDRFVPPLASSKEEVKWTFAEDLSFISKVDQTGGSLAGLLNQDVTILKFIVEDERGNSIPSPVMLVNFEKAKKIATFHAGENLALRTTKPNQLVTFVCERLGFSQETRMFNMDHLSRGRDIIKNKDGIWEIRIKLRPMELHDIAYLNNTTFHKDAAVLQESSRNELDELVLMMQLNPHYKIVLHSHCNSNSKRTIRVPATSSDYFNLDQSVEEFASDKKLTRRRAEVVRNYLLSHGIDKKRVHVVAWGSMEPVVSSTSNDAAELNERLEIELVE